MTQMPLRPLDQDDAVLFWARTHVDKERERALKFARESAERGETDHAQFWRRYAALLSRNLIGGEGCCIAAFDERKPRLLAAIEQAEADGTAEHLPRP